MNETLPNTVYKVFADGSEVEVMSAAACFCLALRYLFFFFRLLSLHLLHGSLLTFCSFPPTLADIVLSPARGSAFNLCSCYFAVDVVAKRSEQRGRHVTPVP